MQNINHIKTLFDSTCDIYQYIYSQDDFTKISSPLLSIKYHNILCRVSYYKNMSNISTLKNNKYNNKIKHDIKLILQNDIDINPGSIIIIKKNGQEIKYKNSGMPIKYSAHQELMIEIYDDIA